MQDISAIPPWSEEQYLQQLQKQPLDYKTMKSKIDRIYLITPFQEAEYVPDALDCYVFIKLANDHPDFKSLLSVEKYEKDFRQDFIYVAIKYMLANRKFKSKALSSLNYYIMLQSIKYFYKCLPVLEKYPKMVNILKQIFDFDKPFFKVNSIVEYPHFYTAPTNDEVEAVDEFVSNLELGARVDVLKTDLYCRRMCWMPATVKKLSAINVTVTIDGEKGLVSIDRKWMQVLPIATKKQHYDWRFHLKEGDKVDVHSFHGAWQQATIKEIKKQPDEGGVNAIELYYQCGEDEVKSVYLSDPSIVPHQTFTGKPATNIQRDLQAYIDDYNDVLYDPQMKHFAICRTQVTKCKILLSLLQYLHSLGFFQAVLCAVKERRFNLEITSQLIIIVNRVQSLFHRTFAIPYLTDLANSILHYVNTCDDTIIRKFSKERYQGIVMALRQFLKRYLPAQERSSLLQSFQLSLILRFLRSDFLDRKLHAVALITKLFKMARNTHQKNSQAQFVEWIRSNKVIQSIYNEKSHSQLISRSTDFLQFYLSTEPAVEELTPLLEWNEAIIKLINQSFDYFNEDFKEKIVAKIKARKSVTEPDAIDIIKRTPGCELWLLRNGGESWVSVVKEKTKRKTDIEHVFKCKFQVVEKITKEISELHQHRLKFQYFMYLNAIAYLVKILQSEEIELDRKIDFARVALEHVSQINEVTFNALLPYSRFPLDSMSTANQKFFTQLVEKLSQKHLNLLFTSNYQNEGVINTIGEGQTALFIAAFLLINVKEGHLQQGDASKVTVLINPNKLTGIDTLMKVVFGNKHIPVTQMALSIVSVLFESLSQQLQDHAFQFKNNFLQNCLQKFYQTKQQYAKYLKILQNLLDESQKQGCDEQNSLNALFPSQTINLKIIDHFNVTKSKISYEVDANLTLHELLVRIARTLNAHIPQMQVFFQGKKLSSKLNGHVIHTLNLTSSELIVEKVVIIQKVPLMDAENKVSEKCIHVIKLLFQQNSSRGVMSKALCQKYFQTCQGEMVSMNQIKIDDIFEKYNKEKDGYLTEQQFVDYYVDRITKNYSVWGDFQSFGVRHDLEDLRNLPFTYPDKSLMTRHLLLKNNKFMSILLDLLQSEDESLAQKAWDIISRLPIMGEQQFFTHKIDKTKKFMFRYWLYMVDTLQKYQLVDNTVLQLIMTSDIETMCIGLKVANGSTFDAPTFSKAMNNLKKIDPSKMSFYGKVLVDNTLKVMYYFLKESDVIKKHFIEHSAQYQSILIYGLMCRNEGVRKMYCKAVGEIIADTAAKDFVLFEIFFKMINNNFEKCDKATISIEYFDLYSQVLKVLKEDPELLHKLQLNWLILTKSTIQLYVEHKCTEHNINSKPDHVAQGYLRIINKLLDSNTVTELVPLVKYIFKKSLFPDSGQDKLKNAKTRKDAYELICQICSFRNQNDSSEGLNALFQAGFKAVYKKMSQNKQKATYSYFYYNNDEARSALGYAGLKNLGCICYMNAMLQQLFMTKPFRSMILMAEDNQPPVLAKKNTKQYDDNLFHQLQNMFANLELTQKQDYNPEQFCMSFKDFEGNSVNVSVQQDAQQFLNLFFDKLQALLKPTPFIHVLENVFGGKICNQTLCMNCKAVSNREQNFYPLSLQIKGYKNIEQSFKKFIQGEVISDYQCDFCKTKADVTKSCFLSKVPNHFIIHLQRMCFNYDKFQNQKVNSRWQFPLKLNVYDYSVDKFNNKNNKNDYQFELKGIVLHYGSADFGHYFSYIKESDSQWIEFNDERVREFDPRDIELDCFGGEYWRRESQSAYLLVYEKVNKSPLQLEFDSLQGLEAMVKKYGLSECVVEKELVQQEIQIINKNNINQDKSQDKSEQTGVVVKKIPLNINMSNIPIVVPEDLKVKIAKANEQFSFTINLSNDDFAVFLQKILSIDPPAELKAQFLELCYECLHLKQMIEGTNISLSEWAGKRFKQLIKGNGWSFMKNYGANWQADILSPQKSLRAAVKTLLQCVIYDIIEEAGLNKNVDKFFAEEQKQEEEQEEDTKGETEEKPQVLQIMKFLDRYMQMLDTEVARHWIRFKEYFEVWASLIEGSAFVQKYCQKNELTEKLFDFILQEYSPFQKKSKRYALSTTHYSAQFQYPLQLITLLIKNGHVLTQVQNQCMRTYPFLIKTIKFSQRNQQLLNIVCKDNLVISQKYAYAILMQLSKVSSSDEVKPIIASIHSFLEIKDKYQGNRLEWILGIPQYVENPKTNSYGVYQINPDQQFVITFVSGIRAVPVLHQLMKFKSKSSHISILLVSMLLQLEADAYINNLDELPSGIPFESSYTFWFEKFIFAYSKDQMIGYPLKNYLDYASRAKTLYLDRPERKYEKQTQYIVGKTLKKKVIHVEKTLQKLEITFVEITSELIENTGQLEGEIWRKKHVQSIKGGDNFLLKEVNAFERGTFPRSNFMEIDSDFEDGEELIPTENPFENRFEGRLLVKMSIKNLTGEAVVVALKPIENVDSNVQLPKYEISVDIKAEASGVITLKKKNIEEEFIPERDLKMSLKIVGLSSRPGYWPKHLITPVSLSENAQKIQDYADY